MDLAAIERAAADAGLALRGAFHAEAADRVPDLPDGRPARTLALLGNAGPGLWSAFAAAPEFADGMADPLNRWSARVIGGLAARFGALALFPFGAPPHRPFITWAKRAGPVAESPLGMLIHPDHGLWHAYRGALAFAEEIALPPREARPRPCDDCVDRPCLAACPVGAFAAPGYDVAACVEHVAGPAGADCLDLGCRARRACPVGAEARYEPEQARFHMIAFLQAQREEAPA